MRDQKAGAGTSRPSSDAVRCSQAEKSLHSSHRRKAAPQRPAAAPIPQCSTVSPRPAADSPSWSCSQLPRGLLPIRQRKMAPGLITELLAAQLACGAPTTSLRAEGRREAAATGGCDRAAAPTRPGLTSAPRRGPSGEPSSRRTCRYPRGRAAGAGCPRCRSAPSADTATAATAGRPSAQPARSSAWLRPAPGRRAPSFTLRSGREAAPPCPAPYPAPDGAARAPNSDRCRRDERGAAVCAVLGAFGRGRLHRAAFCRAAATPLPSQARGRVSPRPVRARRCRNGTVWGAPPGGARLAGPRTAGPSVLTPARRAAWVSRLGAVWRRWVRQSRALPEMPAGIPARCFRRARGVLDSIGWIP